ncbi:MAG TPA: hypothetical protein VGR73_20600 [Bryobacteraceae bacterium]|nr:hypothetical protein [Bryobacteraceae bacterium]
MPSRDHRERFTSRVFPQHAKGHGSTLRPELQAKPDRVAAENRRGAEEYVRQLVESYLDHDAWFRQKVAASLGKLEAGDFLAHEDVGARLHKKFQL